MFTPALIRERNEENNSILAGLTPHAHALRALFLFPFPSPSTPATQARLRFAG